jgi:hypothetical protein
MSKTARMSHYGACLARQAVGRCQRFARDDAS